MNYLVLSSSLDPASRSRLLAARAHEHLLEHAPSAMYLDTVAMNLPLCDGGRTYDDANVQALRKAISDADGILFGVGVYNFAASAAAKNLLELGGDAWMNKVVGFLCAAGGPNAYMAVMGLANSLLLDFRCLIVPRFVYATGGHFTADSIDDPQVEARVEALVRELVRMTEALRSERAGA